MISGRRLTAAAAGLTGLALSLALVGPVAPAQSASAPPRPVPVRSLALPVGTTPQIAWYQQSERRMVRPGKRATPVRFANPQGLFHVAGGWLLATNTCCTSKSGTLRFLGTNGRARTLHALKGWRVVVVASDGRTFVESRSRFTFGARPASYETFRVVRVRDGRVLRKRTFKNQGVQVSVASAGRVLMTVQRRNDRRVGTAQVQSWNIRTGRVSVLRKHAIRSGGGRSGAHLGAGLFVSPEGDHDVVRSLRTGRALWRIARGEGGLLFSPDGTRVATFSGTEYNDGQSFTKAIRIRNARTGRLQTTFTGYFGDWKSTWENERTLLFTAGDSLLQIDGEYIVQGQNLVRCTVSGACQRVRRATAADLTVRRSG